MRFVACCVLVTCGAGFTALRAEPERIQVSPAPLRVSDPLWGIGFDEALADPGALSGVLAGISRDSWAHPIHVRLIVNRAEIETAPGRFTFEALDARLAPYRAQSGVDVYLDIRGDMPSLEGLADWTHFLRELAARARPVVRGYIIGVGLLVGDRSRAAEAAFFLKTSAVDLRATTNGAAVVLGSIGDRDAAWLEALYDEDVGPYVDAVGLNSDLATERVIALVDARDPTCAVVLLGASLGDSADRAAERLATRQLDLLGTRVTGVTYAGAPDVVQAVLASVTFLRDLIDQPLAALDGASTGLTLGVRHRLLFGLTSAATYLIYFSAGAPLEFAITNPTGTRPLIRDPVQRTRQPPTDFRYEPDTRRETMTLPSAPWPLVVDWSLSDGPVRVARTDVASSVVPSLAEIIARYQQARAAQDALLSAYIADATMTQHFRPNVADPGFDVVTENRFFMSGRQMEFEERSFRLNGTEWGADRPPFPLLQAEKVLSLPLDLRLTSDYRYSFGGLAEVDGRACFVVRFDPVRTDQSLYRGTVWVDREAYLAVKVHTVQTRPGAPVLSNEETQRFERVGVLAGRPVSLLVELEGRQDILIAGRSLLVERHIAFRDFQLNPTDFDQDRQRARDSDHIMYRDTYAGLRYLVKRGSERVVANRATTTAKAMLLGVTVDPAYDFPLPLGGLSYLNFEYRGPDSQLAVLFGGVLALINVQKPHLLGDRLDGSLDLFAIAVPGSDRTYDPGGERVGERVGTVPLTAGANIGWRATERVRLLANYQFRFDGYFREALTDEAFRPPPSTTTHGLGLGVEWRRAGYAVAAAWSAHVRSRWRDWGRPEDDEPALGRYNRHNLSVTRDFFSGAHKVHLNGAYYGGRHLDRFSQYQFGFFDEHRIHGVPSAGVRFSDLGMLRASYAFNLFDLYRAEVSLDQAYGRDRFLNPDWQRITGIGLGFLFRGPRQTLLRGDIGKSFLPDRYRKPGSFVFQIQILKPL